jgi:Leucine-rich repeat (LRR) protein
MPTLKTVEQLLDEPDEGPADVSINLSGLDLQDEQMIPVWEKLGGTTEGTGKRQVVNKGLHERVITITCNENILQKLPGLSENLAGKLPNLFGVAFYHNNLNDEGFRQLFGVLRGCPKLQMLNIRNNKLGDNGVSEFVKAMPTWTALNLAQLDLSHNKPITEKYGQPLLAQALNGIPTPQVITSVEVLLEEPAEGADQAHDLQLWLQTKRLRDDNTEELWLKLEEVHKRVTVLRIENNYLAKLRDETSKGEATAAPFAERFGGKFPKLEVLALENNRLDDEGLSGVLQMLTSAGSCGGGIRELLLGKNDISDYGLQQLADALLKLPALTSVTFKGNDHSSMTKGGMAAVALAMDAHPRIVMDAAAIKCLPKQDKK